MLGFYIKRSMYLPIKLALESLVDLCVNEYMNPEVLIKIVDKNICNIHHPFVIPRYNFIYLYLKQLFLNFKFWTAIVIYCLWLLTKQQKIQNAKNIFKNCGLWYCIQMIVLLSVLLSKFIPHLNYYEILI